MEGRESDAAELLIRLEFIEGDEEGKKSVQGENGPYDNHNVATGDVRDFCRELGPAHGFLHVGVVL